VTAAEAPAKALDPSRPRAKGRGIDSGAGLSVLDRVARGKAVREVVPLGAHAEFSPGPDREDSVSVLERQSAARLPELIPVATHA
jgi:hypothetical protein